MSFTRFFWKGCEPLEGDVIQYHKFTEVHTLAQQGNDRLWISDELEVSAATVGTWLSLSQMPKLAHYLLAYLKLGRLGPNDCWLSMRCSHGYAVPLGPWIRAPLEIRDWADLQSIFVQTPQNAASIEDRDFALGFFLGMLIGDASKSKPGNGHRHMDLTLSMEYNTNLRIGDLTCQSAAALGLKMHRIADLQKPAGKPNGFYCWVSEASPLIDWMFNVCLGLKDTERTTYDPVRMNWALNGPEDFRRGLLQGIAESDGSVSVASQTVELWVEPSRDFVARLLLTFDVRSFKNRQALSITKSQVKKAYDIPLFSSQVQSARFLKLQSLAQAKHIAHGKRLPPELRDFIADKARHGLSVPSISDMILHEFGIALSFESVQRWAKRASVL